nr:toxin-activating lysine-acyltransferase [uncultured Rhodoferax sp.]
MTDHPFKLIAPAFHLPPHSDAEAFGSIAWLWMHGQSHRDMPLAALNQALLPAIHLQQYVLVLDTRQQAATPVGYLSWANLSAEAEQRYLHTPLLGLRPEDWNSGDRMWLVDFFAPFGHSAQMLALWKPLLAGISARYMYHRSNERGISVRTFTGARVDPAYARQWWSDRPMLATASTTTRPSQTQSPSP